MRCPQGLGARSLCQIGEGLLVDDSIPLGRRLIFPEATYVPLARMIDNASTHHIQIDVNKAANQVLIRGNGRGKVTALPKCPLSRFTLIVFLAHPASDQLHASGNLSMAEVSCQQVNVVAGCDVVQYRQPITSTSLE